MSTAPEGELPANTAIITGAANGIGLATAKRFAGFGMHVILADLQGDSLDRAQAAVAGMQNLGEVLTVPRWQRTRLANPRNRRRVY